MSKNLTSGCAIWLLISLGTLNTFAASSDQCLVLFKPLTTAPYDPVAYRSSDGRDYLLAPGVRIGKFAGPSYSDTGRMMSDSWYSPNGAFMARTGRTYDMLKKQYFELGELDIVNLKGRRIWDAGTGIGNLVDDLRSLGLKDVFGSDLVIGKEMDQTGYFFAEDMRHTHFRDHSFDVIITTVAYFVHYAKYGGDAAGETRREVLREFYRLCDTGCDIYIGSVGPEIFDLVKQTGFEVVSLNAESHLAHLKRTQDINR